MDSPDSAWVAGSRKVAPTSLSGASRNRIGSIHGVRLVTRSGAAGSFGQTDSPTSPSTTVCVIRGASPAFHKGASIRRR